MAPVTPRSAVNESQKTSCFAPRAPRSRACQCDIRAKSVWHLHCEVRNGRARRTVVPPPPIDAALLSIPIFGFFSLPWAVHPAMVDSSQVCVVPFGLDALVAVLSVRHGEVFWVFPPIVTAASLVGAALTAGRTAGDAGLPRLVPARHSSYDRLATTGTGALAAAAVMPPPFPLPRFS